jgi:hypothetical protein
MLSLTLKSETLYFGGIQYISGTDITLKRHVKLDRNTLYNAKTPTVINELKFKDLIYWGDVLVTGKDFLKIRFAPEGVLIVYPHSEVRVIENIHENGTLKSKIQLIRGSVRIIEKPTKTVLHSVNVSDWVIEHINGEVIVEIIENKITIYSLEFDQKINLNNKTLILNEGTGYEFTDSKIAKESELKNEDIKNLNKKYPPPVESFIFITKNHEILLKLLFSQYFTHPNADQGKYKDVSGGKLELGYLYHLYPKIKLGLKFFNGSIDPKLNGMENEKNSISGLTIVAAIPVFEDLWTSVEIGGGSLTIAGTNDGNKTKAKYDGLVFTTSLNKSWNLNDDISYFATVDYTRFNGKIKEYEFFDPSGQEKISFDSYSLGVGVSYNF